MNQSRSRTFSTNDFGDILIMTIKNLSARSPPIVDLGFCFNHNSRGWCDITKKIQTQWEHNIFSKFLIKCKITLLLIIEYTVAGVWYEWVLPVRIYGV